MSDQSKILGQWKNEIRLAKEFCSLHNLHFEFSLVPFVVGEIKGEGISLLLYPHKTSSGYYHIRVRNNRSIDERKALETMWILDKFGGYNCTFSYHLSNEMRMSELKIRN